MGKNLIDLAGLEEFKRKQDEVIESKRSTLQTNIDNEVRRATQKEEDLASSLLNETTRAKESEKVIADNLDIEKQKRLEGDTALGSRITSEIARAEAAESVNSNSISNEKSRALAAEKILTDSLNSEISRAKVAEGNNLSKIQTVEDKVEENYTELSGRIQSSNQRTDTELAKKQNVLDWDLKPTENSSNPINSGNLYKYFKTLSFVISKDKVGNTANFKFNLDDWNILDTTLDLNHTHNYSDLLGKPTTLSGFGITDVSLNNGEITIGSNNITPVTSVSMTVPTGFSILGSPIKKTGNLAISFAPGYSLPTTAKQSQWDTAFANNHTHSNKSILDKITDQNLKDWGLAVSSSHAHANKTDLDTINSSKLRAWDKAVTDSHTHTNKAILDGISTDKISHWDGVYDWFTSITSTESDGIINKWEEIVNFLQGISSTDSLKGLVDGINSAISSEKARAMAAEDKKQDKLVFDTMPTVGSRNVVHSDGIYKVLERNERVITESLNDLNNRINSEVLRAMEAEKVNTDKITSEVNRINSEKSPTSHTHAVRINGETKTISETGGAIVDLGTYLTSHQSLSDYSTTPQMNSAISSAINALDVVKVGGSPNQYISEIEQTNGKIIARSGVIPEYTFQIKSSPTTNGVIDFKFKKDAVDILTESVDFRHTHSFNSITSLPTTLGGYGITDAKISGGTITLGGNTITPITSLAEYSTTAQMTASINNAIGALDVAKVGGATGQYISGIQETDGKISATVESLPEYSLKIIENKMNGLIDFIFKKGDQNLLSETVDFSHSHNFNDLTSIPATIEDYGITNAYNKEETKEKFQAKIRQVDHGTSDTTFALTPNTFHVWGTVSSLSLTLAPGENGIMSEYMFQFTSPSTATTLSLPSTIKWYNNFTPTIQPGRTYQASILNNVIVMGNVM